MEAAAAVCCPRGESDAAIPEGVISLAAQNLLRREEDAESQPRFGMLETILEYARECLAAHRETDAFQRRHAEHYLALAEAASRRCTDRNSGPGWTAWSVSTITCARRWRGWSRPGTPMPACVWEEHGRCWKRVW